MLPKKLFPLWKLNPDNLVLIHPEVHRLFDSGTQEERDSHPLWDWRALDELVEQKKTEYISFKEKHLL